MATQRGFVKPNDNVFESAGAAYVYLESHVRVPAYANEPTCIDATKYRGPDAEALNRSAFKTWVYGVDKAKKSHTDQSDMTKCMESAIQYAQACGFKRPSTCSLEQSYVYACVWMKDTEP